jgi:ribosome biogenesis GTPase A
MNKARKELTKLMATSDLVVEVLDARAPGASSNPLLAEIRGTRPCIKILNKSDLADLAISHSWQAHFNAQPATRCLLSGADQVVSRGNLLNAASQLCAGNGNRQQLVIVGIPNVGKSTLMNHLAGRKLAATGNTPALTRHQQRIRLDEHWYLVDTPGMLWPKLEDQEAAYRLATTGTIRNTAVEAEDIAWFAAKLLLDRFRPCLEARYEITDQVGSAEQLLDSIALSRGAIARGGAPSLHKASEILLNDFRSGKLGRLSLEPAPVN